VKEEYMFQEIGTFEVRSGRIEVSDPCYSGGDGHRIQALNGTWIGEIEMSDEGSWGNRVAKLRAHREGILTPPFSFIGVAAVDSGQMSISDADKFHLLPGELYDTVCGKTSPAGIIEDFAVASSSGYGDGGYDIGVAKDSEGRVVAVEVVFIPDDPECTNCGRTFTSSEDDVSLCDDCYAEENSEYCSECGNLTPDDEMRDDMCEDCFREWSEKNTCLTCGCVAEGEVEDGECEHCRAEHHITG
jgi:hypothetical protein